MCKASFALQTLALNRSFANQYFPPHTPIAQKAEPGIREGGRFIVLKAKMSDPGQGIALYKGHY